MKYLCESYTNGFWVLGAWAKESVCSVSVQAEASMLSPLKSMKTTTATTQTQTSLVDIIAVELPAPGSEETSCSTLMMRPFVCLFITVVVGTG